MTEQTLQFSLAPANNARLITLCGEHDNNLKLIEKKLNIAIKNRGHKFSITGTKTTIKKAQTILRQLYELTQNSSFIPPEEVRLMLQSQNISKEHSAKEITIQTKGGLIKSRSKNQQIYMQNIMQHDINFGIGPAGTGKTFLAVACAIDALDKDQVRRIILVRPAVEAGEHLGFLPGDLAQKVDPYLRPLYDALYEMFGFDKVDKLIAKHVIEIAPLAYMRGRTLNDAFIILDESQNTTPAQMKMFLTRIGFGSKAVVTGDITQIDLARGQKSGLIHVANMLKHIKGISFTHFIPKDVVRHPLVQSIIEAYEEHDKRNNT